MTAPTFVLGEHTHSIDSGHGRVLYRLLEAALGLRRWPAGEKGMYPGQWCPPGWVPLWALTDGDCGGQSGGRRCRELRARGLAIENGDFRPADGEASSLTMRRLDPGSPALTPDIYAAFSLRKPASAPPGAPAGPLDAFPEESRSSRTDASGPIPAIGDGVEGPGSRGAAPVDAPRAVATGPSASPASCSGATRPGTGRREGTTAPGRLPPVSSPAALQIILTPHHDEKKHAAAGDLVIPCYAVGRADHYWNGDPEHRWRYANPLFLGLLRGSTSPDTFLSILKASYRKRLEFPAVKAAILADVRAAIAAGRVCLIYGDHEPACARGAKVAAEVIAWAARKLGVRTEIIDELEGAAARTEVA